MPIPQPISLSDLTDADQPILGRLSARGDEMLARTIEWAGHNTGSWNADGLNAFAPILSAAFAQLDAAVQLIETRPIEKIGNDGEVRRLRTGPVLRATVRPQAPVQVVLTGHYDTVFPPDTFTKIQDLGGGRYNGPGLADMKGGLVVMLEALAAFEAGENRDRLGYNIVISPDEEIGNLVSAEHIAEAASAAHIGMTFEPAMEDGAMAGGRKGSAIFDFTFKGRAAHAGREPEAGRNAINAAAQLVAAIEALNGKREGVTFNVGAIDGGGAVNIVPELAVVRLGVRAPDGASADWATKALQQALDLTLRRDGISGALHGGFYRPPKPRNAAQSSLFNAVAETGKALKLDLRFTDTGGVCEGNNVFAAGVPNVDTLGVRGGSIHSHQEFVCADSFTERASLSALLLNRIADGRIDAAGVKRMMQE